MRDFIKSAEKLVVKSNVISEKEIEDEFVKYARSKGCLPMKLVVLRASGFPDRTILCPGGRAFFIEFKTKSGSIKPTQRMLINKLKNKGFTAEICRTADDAKCLLDEFLNDV